MKLVCVNSSIIKLRSKTQNLIIENTGEGLTEGKIYETKSKPYINENGFECYYIVGLGPKLKCRFAELLDDDKSSIEKELEEAISNEDYEKAAILRDKLK